VEPITIRQAPYDDPGVQHVIPLVMAELSRRYGGSGDDTPVKPSDFTPPHGAFLLATDGDGTIVGCVAWRSHDRDAELKRMFTITEARGRGIGRQLLAAVEASARAAGRERMILETGDKQPEAIALYEKYGYERIEDFGYYAGDEGVLCYAKKL
jgi:ribosomal protein S18 acetylase RimI-like enzyme